MSRAAKSEQSAPPPPTYAHAVARWCIRPLLDTPVTPNHLTTLRLLTGIGAAVALGTGSHFWAVWGGCLFFISAILDRADGELARLSGHMSTGGHWYDLYSDTFVNVAVFIGIGFGLADTIPGLWAPLMGVVSGLSVGAIFLTVFDFHRHGSHPGVVFNYPKGVDFDDALFIVTPCAWFDALWPLLVAATIGAPLFLIFSLLKWRRFRSGD